MPTKKYELDTGPCCSPQGANHKDYESEDGQCADKRKMLINPHPEGEKCMICGRHVRELKAFGELGDSLFDDFSGAKLVNNLREDYPGYTKSSWECRACVARPGPLWAIDEEDRLGRPLTEREYIDMRYKLELSLLEMHEATPQETVRVDPDLATVEQVHGAKNGSG